MVPLDFRRLEDGPASRDVFPFLSESLDEAAAFNEEFPDSAHAEVHIAEVAIPWQGSLRKLVLVQLGGSLHCGTLGCTSWVVEIEAGGAARTLLSSSTHPSAPPMLSRCGGEVSFLLVTGHGMDLAWTEWLLSAEGLREVILGPMERWDPQPPCEVAR